MKKRGPTILRKTKKRKSRSNLYCTETFPEEMVTKLTPASPPKLEDYLAKTSLPGCQSSSTAPHVLGQEILADLENQPSFLNLLTAVGLPLQPAKSEEILPTQATKPILINNKRRRDFPTEVVAEAEKYNVVLPDNLREFYPDIERTKKLIAATDRWMKPSPSWSKDMIKENEPEAKANVKSSAFRKIVF